ncbi:hydroxymethylpyrimidine/phosphomethylpyrimidine kinase [Labilibacter marinus]|uniref:hydroxymethylpyrimidine/phosphomethylpyrimidine kinase n=1 Tax=Labilibacter marinus TaxID=1477105 RepID=UPI00082CAB03|nr:hydroxymethylpyrimidine/phosphomethylpyrimidine kinase [Labilibacter marinus]
MKQAPFVLTIAGHDPSAGAGITADLKTFEQHSVYGFSVVTAITVQNDHQFLANHPVGIDVILHQIKILMESYPIDVAKIGLVNSFDELKEIIALLKNRNPDIKIIWDPIIKSSSGFNFHQDMSIEEEILNKLFLITPNYNEYEMLKNKGIDLFKYSCLLKGGHNKEKPGTDILITNGEQTEIEGKSFHGQSKHGTGCVLSSAISANLAHNLGILQACIQGKKYVERFILSNEGNLGFHQQQ